MPLFRKIRRKKNARRNMPVWLVVFITANNLPFIYINIYIISYFVFTATFVIVIVLSLYFYITIMLRRMSSSFA